MNASELAIQVQADVSGCLDPTFHSWARESLVWLPEKGMGYLDVSESAPYDASYFAKYEGYASTEMGRAITESRISMLLRHVIRGSAVVDVGVGSGSFIEAAKEVFPVIGGYDINPASVEWLRTRAQFVDPRRAPVDVLTFWDSLEHIRDAASYIVRVRAWVFCSLPLVPGEGPPPKDWKHLRRDEHCFYWTRSGLIRWMAEHDFECVEHNTAESLLGREDISSFAFRRVT